MPAELPETIQVDPIYLYIPGPGMPTVTTTPGMIIIHQQHWWLEPQEEEQPPNYYQWLLPSPICDTLFDWACVGFTLGALIGLTRWGHLFRIKN
jgi:hypothetical protein